jgi:hypothetical protein
MHRSVRIGYGSAIGRDAKEAVLGSMPKFKGNIMTTHCFVDANRAEDKETRRSQNGCN